MLHFFVGHTCSHFGGPAATARVRASRAVGKERVESGTRDGRQKVLQSKKLLFEAI